MMGATTSPLTPQQNTFGKRHNRVGIPWSFGSTAGYALFSRRGGVSQASRLIGRRFKIPSETARREGYTPALVLEMQHPAVPASTGHLSRRNHQETIAKPNSKPKNNRKGVVERDHIKGDKFVWLTQDAQTNSSQHAVNGRYYDAGTTVCFI